MDFYILDNSNNCVIKGLRDETGAFVDSALLELNIYGRGISGTLELVLNKDGSTPSWPVQFVAEGKGNYRAAVPSTLNLLPSTEYRAEITGTVGSRVFEESRRLFAKPRLTR